MLAEMSVRKHVQYDGEKVPGYVHLGTVIEIHDSLPATTIHHHWHGCHNIYLKCSIVSVDVCVGMHICREL